MSGAAHADLVVLAVPSFAVASTAEQLSAILPAGKVVVNVGKGLDSKHGYCRFSETISRAMGGKNPVVALTGRPMRRKSRAACRLRSSQRPRAARRLN